MEKVGAVERFRDSDLFSEREKLALEWAEKMTITGERVTDDLFQQAQKHFAEAEIVELTAAVALENFRSKFNVALGVESQGFCILK